jgi:type IV secretory pathway VirB2 component (pilin)
MKMKHVKKTAMVILLVMVAMLLVSTVAMAGTTDLPWEKGIEQVKKSVTGPVATVMSTLAIVGCGLGIAFGEGGEGMKKLLWVVIGVAICLLASKVINVVGTAEGLIF